MPVSAALALVGRGAALRHGPRPLVEIVRELPRHGAGFRVARAKWALGDAPSHVDITRVNYLKVGRSASPPAAGGQPWPAVVALCLVGCRRRRRCRRSSPSCLSVSVARGRGFRVLAWRPPSPLFLASASQRLKGPAARARPCAFRVSRVSRGAVFSYPLFCAPQTVESGHVMGVHTWRGR